jgi:serine/threonine-protein kinase
MTVAVGDTVGRYRIEASLADGEMVQVFKAVALDDGQTVALKVIHPGITDEEVLRRFEREGRVAGRVKHPHLVSVLDTGRVAGVPYMAMEFVSGRTLARILEQDGPLGLPEVVALVRQIGSALDALHQEGIVHRDVRSTNVLVDVAGVAALTDFGFARSQADTRITELHRPVGTLDYRAPELFLGRSADRASDVYSLGCLAYECLVGVPPFAGQSDLVELGKAHIHERPPEPRDRRPETPPEFAHAVLTALVKDPARRPPSGAAYSKLLRFGLRAAG